MLCLIDTIATAKKGERYQLNVLRRRGARQGGTLCSRQGRATRAGAVKLGAEPQPRDGICVGCKRRRAPPSAAGRQQQRSGSGPHGWFVRLARHGPRRGAMGQ